MKFTLLIAFLIFGACAAKELYSSTPSDINSSEKPIDLNKIFGDKERLRTIITCFLGIDKCDTELLTILRDTFPKSVTEACQNCTDREKYAMRMFLEASAKTHPDLLQALKKKTDPDNKYYEALTKAVANY